MSNVSEVNHNYRTYDPEATKNKNSDLSKDTFLKILITQMQNQDPLNPMEDRDFIAQMAQFSALEQMQNLNETMTVTQTALVEHIRQMNNNLVKSQTALLDEIERIGKHFGVPEREKEKEEEKKGSDPVDGDNSEE
ncbi:flagellar hook capping FlgD N-terminal domain-containing protein [Alkaliphilus peptidifermentans]|uniref:Flagellar basal-body rod modification protein FlgD n=1 Tax=Alkaliphilus peptidifermentans DSM 18978 TaxID=1120976 RepID=A0A1G5DIF8_9FIRM|nr:flagellar hook capping FlgD N-terminal domain-containing protein [Alkaliphilus peptidifermentans]SCY14160.1 flagellar basal-body rod modification protein FlgD [Alkaliphilus peptidifermentans DSM 18978]